MRILNLITKFLLCFLFFASCSSDDRVTHVLIGQWRQIEHYELDEPVEVTDCDSNWIEEFSSDGSIDGFPDDLNIEYECVLRISAGFTWSWKGNNQYEIKGDNEEGQIYIFYKEGVNLVVEYPNGTTKIVYKPYLKT